MDLVLGPQVLVDVRATAGLVAAQLATEKFSGDIRIQNRTFSLK